MSNEEIGMPRSHPDFIKIRKERFIKILKEAIKILKLSDIEKKKVNELIEVLKNGQFNN